MGRILGVADAFDAITSVRTYKDASPPSAAIRILKSEAGKQFDPHLVEIFCELVESGKLELQSQRSGNPPPPPDEGIQPPDGAFYAETEIAPEMQD